MIITLGPKCKLEVNAVDGDNEALDYALCKIVNAFYDQGRRLMVKDLNYYANDCFTCAGAFEDARDSLIVNLEEDN